MLKTTLILFVILGTIDFLWLRVFAKNYYTKELGALLKKDFSVALALLVYILLAFGLSYFVFQNQTTLSGMLLGSILFGGLLYGIYELTNLAVIENWSLKIVITDTLWGALLSGLASTLTFYIEKFLV